MSYSYISCNAEKMLEKLKNIEIHNLIDFDWTGVVTLTENKKIKLNFNINKGNMDINSIMNLMEVKMEELYKQDKSHIYEVNINGEKYSFMAVLVNTYKKYKTFTICISHKNFYTKRDISLIEFIAKVVYEDILLNDEVIEERNYLKNILDSTESAVVSINLDGDIIIANKATFGILGHDPEKIIGDKYYKYISDFEREPMTKIVEKVIRENKSYYDKETVFKSFNRGTIVLSRTVTPINDVKGNVVGATIIGTDATDKMVLRRELEQINQFAIIGEVAQGVAHDIKNPLMNIRGCAKLLEKDFNDFPKHKEFIEPIIKQVDRINDVVEQMLTYSRVQYDTDSNVKFNINNEIDSCIKMVHFHNEKKYVKIEKNYEEDLPLIKGKGVQIQQVLINILLNAFEAIKEDGIIKISTKNHEIIKRVSIVVEDNGNGIAPNQIENIFNPFYTTKDSGTGIGLCIVKRLVKALNGEIHVYSQVGSGTIIEIKLLY